LAHWYRGLAFARKQLYGDALRELAAARELLAANTAVRADIGHVYALSGDAPMANRVIAELSGESTRRYVTAYEVALIYVGLRKYGQAFEWLERAFRERSDQLIYLGVDPRLDPIRSDARFADLTRRVGIPH